MQNPETNRLEALHPDPTDATKLVRPDGTPIPKNAIVFHEGEEVVLKGYTYRVAHINEASIVLEPVGVPKIGEPTRGDRVRENALRRQIAEREHGR